MEMNETIASVVRAYIEQNDASHEDICALIISLRRAFETDVSEPALDAEAQPPKKIKASITDSHLISFIDGKPYKALKRHLTVNGMTPDEYRARFGLPVDYPMVSPEYSRARSKMALESGLGNRRIKKIGR
jgi:predicted transcriptional regulator